MKNTGALLKSKRESSNLSLSEVALATKINPKILAAIENGDEANLPAKTFLKGFVRSYALFLKMDVDQVMRSFQEETGGPPPERVVEPPKPEPSTSSSRRRAHEESSSGMRTVAVVVIVVLIGLIIGVRELIEKYQRERVVESTADLKVTPVDPATPAAPVPAVGVGTTTPAVAEVKPVETKPEEKVPEVKLAEVKPAEPKPVEVKPTEAKVAETKPAAPKLEEVKPVETKVTEVKPVELKNVFSPEIEAARPIMAARPIDLIRGPINNLVELRPVDLSLPKPEEIKPVEAKAPEVKALETKVVEAKPPEVKAPEAKPAEVKPVAKAPEVKPPEVKPTEAKPPEAKPAETAATEPAPVLKAAKNEIILEALDKVEVKFQVKGETKRVSLGPSQVHTIHADTPMTLDLSDGGAVNIILNGRERGVPGDLGKPKTIKIP